jgi:hypothetical protein
MFHDLVAEARAQKYGYRLVTLLRCLRLLLARFEETRLDNGGVPALIANALVAPIGNSLTVILILRSSHEGLGLRLV